MAEGLLSAVILCGSLLAMGPSLFTFLALGIHLLFLPKSRRPCRVVLKVWSPGQQRPRGTG